MIKKLKRRFVLIAMLSITGLLVVILGTINIVNYTMVTKDADRVIDMITRGNGDFDVENQNNQPHDEDRPMGPNSPETRFSVRYFTIALNNGDARVVSYQMNAYSVDEAINLAKELSNNKGGWTNLIYRYRVYEVGSETYVTMIDQGRELSPTYRVLIASLIGSIVGLIIVFFILLSLAERFVKPISDSDLKQKKFIAQASNELKNPITVIALDVKRIEEKNGESIETQSIEKQTNKLIKLTHKLNDLVILDKDSINKTNVNLSNLLKEVFSKYKELFDKKQLSLNLDIQDDIKYSGNDELLRRLMNELIDNACKFASSYTYISLKKVNDRIILEIKNDKECGNYSGTLDRFFEKFYKEDKDVPGDGLGLAIAKDIVKLHNGRIMAYGKNIEFTIKVEL